MGVMVDENEVLILEGLWKRVKYFLYRMEII